LLLTNRLQRYEGRQLWDVATGAPLRVLSPNSKTRGACFTPDSRCVVLGGEDGSISLWECASGAERQRWKLAADGDVCLMSPNGRWLVTWNSAGTGLVWDMDALRQKIPLDNAPDASRIWQHLLDADAGKAYRAMLRSVQQPDEAVAALRAKLRPVPRLKEGQLASWIADLNSDEFHRRDQATKGLELHIEVAYSALLQSLQAPAALEAERRIRQILVAHSHIEGERLRLDRALEVLEEIGSADARRLLSDLAQGEPGAYLTERAKETARRLEQRNMRQNQTS
jgi:hypothetical protein